MPLMEHPDIEKVNHDGYLGTAAEDSEIEKCDHCDVILTRGCETVEFDDYIFCDEACLIEAFSENPRKFGAELKTLA